MADLEQPLSTIIDEWIDELVEIPNNFSMSGADELQRIGQEILLVANQLNKRIMEEEEDVL